MILFCGDPHGNFECIIQTLLQIRPSTLIFLGDLQAEQPLDQLLAPLLPHTDIWFIHGNHDTDTDLHHDHLFRSGLANKNLHGRVVELEGQRIAGLGGVFRGQIWSPPSPWRYYSPEMFLKNCGIGNYWRQGLPRKHRSSIFPSEYAELAQQQANILVTHEAPSCHKFGFKAIDDLASRMGVQQVFHGHHH